MSVRKINYELTYLSRKQSSFTNEKNCTSANDSIVANQQHSFFAKQE
jgi:hypothetical protein